MKVKNFWNKYREKIVTFLLFSVLFVGVISVIALVGGAVMRLFGFRYESVGSIILFFVIASIFSYPVSLVVEALPKALLHLKKVSRPAAVCLYLILDTAATALGLCVVDYFMESVSATELAILVVSFLLALLGVKDVGSGERTAEDHKLMHGSI